MLSRSTAHIIAVIVSIYKNTYFNELNLYKLTNIQAGFIEITPRDAIYQVT